MDFRAEFDTDQVGVFVSTEFVVEYFSFSDGDGFEDIAGHVEDDQVAVRYCRARVECGMGRLGRGLGTCSCGHVVCFELHGDV